MILNVNGECVFLIHVIPVISWNCNWKWFSFFCSFLLMAKTMKFNYQKNTQWISILHVLLLFEFGVLSNHSQAIVLSKPIVLVCSHNCEKIFSWTKWTKYPSWALTGRGWRGEGGGKIKVGLLLISCQTFFCFVWFPLRFRDGQKTYHLLPVRQTPPTFPLLTSRLIKWIVKMER